MTSPKITIPTTKNRNFSWPPALPPILMSAERSSARSAPTNIGMHKNDASSSSSFDHVAYFHSFVSRHGGVALVFVRATGHVSLAEHACRGVYFVAALTSLISFLITVHEQKRHIAKKMAKPLSIMTDGPLPRCRWANAPFSRTAR